jgi:hypothetical protein
LADDSGLIVLLDCLKDGKDCIVDGERPSELDVLNGLLPSWNSAALEPLEHLERQSFFGERPGGNGLNGAKRLNGWNDLNAIHSRSESQVQTSKALNSLSPIYPLSFRLYPSPDFPLQLLV